MAKIKKKRNHTISKRKKELLDQVLIDVCGKLPRGLYGQIFFLLIIDNYSHYTTVFTASRKDKCADELKTWRKTAETKTEKKIKVVRCDNVPELLKVVNEWTEQDGIQVNPTAVNTSSQNGMAERGIQTIEQISRALLADANISMTL